MSDARRGDGDGLSAIIKKSTGETNYFSSTTCSNKSTAQSTNSCHLNVKPDNYIRVSLMDHANIMHQRLIHSLFSGLFRN